jgi:hypothetical protein
MASIGGILLLFIFYRLIPISNQPWITPSVFESTGNDAAIDEYTLGQLLDKPTAESILKKHWDTVNYLSNCLFYYSKKNIFLLSASGLQRTTLLRFRPQVSIMFG